MQRDCADLDRIVEGTCAPRRAYAWAPSLQKWAPLLAGAALAVSGLTNAHAHGTPVTTKLKNVFLDAGNPGKTLNSGNTTIESTQVVCIYSDCTFAMSIMANVGQATCKDEWAIVGLVDGHKVDGGPLLESLPNEGNTQTHTWQGIYTTGSGSHTLTFQLSLPCPANANQWSVRYLITTTY